MTKYEQLITEHLPLVKHIANSYIKNLSSNVTHDDLVSYGSVGLMDAINKFEPERGWKFKTYASWRIKGAMIDGLRSTDWVPRSVREKTDETEQTILNAISLNSLEDSDAFTTKITIANHKTEETKLFLSDAVNRLPERERKVLFLYYYEDLMLSEIGNIFGLTEAWACKMHKQAIELLRSQYMNN